MSEHFICPDCNTVHTGWPALVYIAPDNYHVMSEAAKAAIGELDSDFCVIRHAEQTDRFIRCTLTQKVVDSCQHLDYGLWVSLSEKSFQDYADNYNNDHHETRYFGWLCNTIPEYDFNASIPMTVYTRTGNSRPEIAPHHDFDHPFVHDYYNGISTAEAERRIRAMMHTGVPDKEQPERKPWWKLW